MAEIYNPSRSPITVALSDGKVTSIPGKGKLVVSAKLLGSADIARKKEKRHILLRNIESLDEAPVAVAAVAAVAPESESAPALAQAPAVEAVLVVAEAAPTPAEQPASSEVLVDGDPTNPQVPAKRKRS